ncbi:hypothetical protein L228DRAFT_243930 [Xylona heveae TC161]|uniref:Glycerophosphocholine acyltransferase 1 n=1 Tax=Xylona heveae (strain CBS 132557 / TC161) TaxID=1328760 RepID=A0A161TG84_XYLHT|nr:hypothetical protein L228DRAFT_243930 [Xylona heveae TC161]KZF25137.1 hypothetical protein L228DRAFT_243930 [Xylona heveae TC161]
MSDPIAIHGSKSNSEPALNEATEITSSVGTTDTVISGHDDDLLAPSDKASGISSPPSPRLSRNGSFSDKSSSHEDWDPFPPIERLTLFDILDNLALPQRLERLQNTIQAQTERVRRHREKLKSTSMNARDLVVDEWRRRVPAPEEQLEKYRKRMRDSVDKLGRRWNDTKAVTTREKISFIGGVLNIFISGYLIGARPESFYLWYTWQLLYYMPIRYYSYHKKGWHYFLADLCYFTNLLAFLSFWVAPRSKRLFISTFCLAYGNNAVAIAMWRNSLVFHSLDKVTSLFIHIMPPVALHCIVHLMPPEFQKQRFPAVYAIKTSPPGSKEHYSLLAMMIWATVPYIIWQLSYHFLITVRRREKIAAGRPTSFTWLRKSYAKTWIGKTVLSLPHVLQEPAFMLIQYGYALCTIIPCPLWFWYRWPSAIFLLVVFTWSVYNGATYYIDVFGKRFQNELEQLRKDVAKWQTSPAMTASSQPRQKSEASDHNAGDLQSANVEGTAEENGSISKKDGTRRTSIDNIPLLDSKNEGPTGSDIGIQDIVRERK